MRLVAGVAVTAKRASAILTVNIDKKRGIPLAAINKTVNTELKEWQNE